MNEAIILGALRGVTDPPAPALHTTRREDSVSPDPR